MLVLPKEDMGGDVTYGKAVLSMISHPDEEGANSVEITKFPTGEVSYRTTTVSTTQSLQYDINRGDLRLNSSGEFKGLPYRWFSAILSYLPKTEKWVYVFPLLLNTKSSLQMCCNLTICFEM